MFRSKGVKLVAFGFSSVLMSASLISFLILTSNTVSADDSIVSDVSISVPVSCSVTGTLDTAHTATVNNGTYQEDIGTTTFKVVCNDNSGYSIYAVGYSNEEFGNTKMLATIGGVLTPTSDFNTGLATSGNTSAWAMKIIPVTTASSGTTQPYTPTIESDTNGTFSNYHIVPSTYTKVATFASSTDFTIGSSIQSTYRAFISSNQLAGNYNGKVRYTLVHPASEVPLQPQTATSGCINYFANAGDAVGTMGCQVATDGINIDLLASNFSRAGYGFAGWSDAYDYASNNNARFYGPQETITVPNGTTANGLALYAVWVKSAGSLQDSTKVAELCGVGTGSLNIAPNDGTATLASVSALTDQRDNQTYAIAKLADGKCWMIENLRLENTAVHNSDGALAQGYGTSTIYGSFSGLAEAESANFGSTTANSLYYSGTQSGSATVNIGTANYPSDRIPRYNNTNTSTRASNPAANSEAMYSYGNYYGWHAAIADLTYNGTNNYSFTNTSLCPAGWHLPTGGLAYSSGDTSGVNITGDTSTFRDFYNLGYKVMDEIRTAREDTSNNDFSRYSSKTINSAGRSAGEAFRSFPNNFIYSGYFDTSSTSSRGSIGTYWSSTVHQEHFSCLLRLSGSILYPGTDVNSKYFGYPIRCTIGS